MKRLLTILLFSVLCLAGSAQGYRITLNSSNILFNDFNQKKLFFTGFSTDLSLLIKKVSIDVSFRYYIPRTYYGRLGFYNFNDYMDKYIPVYAKGGAFSLSYIFAYDIFKSKSEKLTIAPNYGLLMFNHKGKINDEPLIRIYGGSEGISLLFFGMSFGAHVIYKIGYIPVYFRFARSIAMGKREYDDFKTSGFFQADIGIAFPIMKCPPNSQINKISY